MNYFKNKPIDIAIFPIIIILFNLYYWYTLYTGTWVIINQIFTPTPLTIFLWINIALTTIEIYMVTYGFHKRKNYARIYEIAILTYSSIWALTSMYILQLQIIKHYLYLILFITLTVYLLMSKTKKYFTTKQKNTKKQKEEKKEYLQIGKYILHKTKIKKRNGKQQTFYFFSKGKSDNGTPCKKPENYTLKFNKKTKVPYLKKDKNIKQKK